MRQNEFKIRKKHFSVVGFEPLTPCKRGGSSNHLGHPAKLFKMPQFLLHNPRRWRWSRHIFADVTFEFSRVEGCH